MATRSDSLQDLQVDNEDGVDDVLVALALAEAVQAAGPTLAGEPRRVHGMVVDVLGAQSRTRRAEIDAVVLAAEETIPEDLLAGSIDENEAVLRLLDRGLSVELSTFAVDVWQYALGLLESSATPPSLTNSVETFGVSTPDQDEPLAFGADTVMPTQLPDPVVIVGGQAADPGDDAGPAETEPPGDAQRASRFKVIIGAAAALVLIGVAAIALIGGGDDAAEVAAVSIAETKVTFPAEPSGLGEVGRTWVVEDGVLTSTVVVTNDTDAATSGRHYEVVPKNLAATADLITSEPAHAVVKHDPVIAWDVALEPGASTTVLYRVAVPDGTDTDQLETWKGEHATEAAAFEAERSAAPTITFENPPGQLVMDPEVDIAGTVTPIGSTVVIAGVPAEPDANGRFVVRIGGLAAGDNSIAATATSPYGVEASGATVVHHQVPVSDEGAGTSAATTDSGEQSDGDRATTTPPGDRKRSTTRPPVVDPPPVQQPPVAVPVPGPTPGPAPEPTPTPPTKSNPGTGPQNPPPGGGSTGGTNPPPPPPPPGAGCSSCLPPPLPPGF